MTHVDTFHHKGTPTITKLLPLKKNSSMQDG